jgi:Tfp pilus assembly protein PilO
MGYLRLFLDFARRNPLQVVSYAVIILCGTTSWFLWRWQGALTSQHQEVQRSGEAMLQSLTSHARVTAEVAKVAEAVAFIDRNLVNEGDLAENLGYFYQIEGNTRTKFTQLNQMSSAPQTADRPYKTVPFKLRTTGSYAQVLRVLRELETGPRLLRVQSFNLATEGPQSADSETVTLDLNVELLARP